jgi:hypothetical protein
MMMASPLRLALAKETYQLALRTARENSTARTWARLLRAARNLREARADFAPVPTSTQSRK